MYKVWYVVNTASHEMAITSEIHVHAKVEQRNCTLSQVYSLHTPFLLLCNV